MKKILLVLSFSTALLFSQVGSFVKATTPIPSKCNGGKLSSLANYKGSETKYKSVTSKGFTYYAGYKQITSNNQDAYAIKTDSSGNVCWNVRLTGATSASTPDERCKDLAVDEKSRSVFLICSADGGSYSGFKSPRPPYPYDPSYFQGPGGAKAAYIAKLNLDGKILAGTFLQGVIRKDGKLRANTINLKTVAINNNQVEVSGDTAFGAPTTQAKVRCKGGTYKARFDMDLSSLLFAECGGGTELKDF